MTINDPWFDDKLANLWPNRSKAERKVRKQRSGKNQQKTRNNPDLLSYVQCKNTYNYHLKKKKINYYNNSIKDNESDKKSLFRIINTLKKKSNDTPNPVSNSDKQLADEFASFFADKVIHNSTRFW